MSPLLSVSIIINAQKRTNHGKIQYYAYEWHNNGKKMAE